MVDDNPTTRAALKLFIEAHAEFLLIGEAASGEEAIAFCEQTEPDVIVLDIRLPGKDGIETAAVIKQRHPRVQIVALSSFAERDVVARAYEAGIHEYVQKSSPGILLTDAIRSAYRAREAQS